jgi:hypothetical protein
LLSAVSAKKIRLFAVIEHNCAAQDPGHEPRILKLTLNDDLAARC